MLRKYIIWQRRDYSRMTGINVINFLSQKRLIISRSDVILTK